MTRLAFLALIALGGCIPQPSPFDIEYPYACGAECVAHYPAPLPGWEPQGPTTIMPFGQGWIVNAPGQAPATVMPFGDGWIVNEPGEW